jgi:hypothetical protein
MLFAAVVVAAVWLASIVPRTVVHLDVGTLSFIAGSVIPLLVGLLTKYNAHPGLKGTLNALLSAIGGGIAVAIGAHGTVSLGTWLFTMAQTFALSIATYYGVWKPTGVAQAVQSSTACIGLALPSDPPTPVNTGPPVPAAPATSPAKKAVSTKKRS